MGYYALLEKLHITIDSTIQTMLFKLHVQYIQESVIVISSTYERINNVACQFIFRHSNINVSRIRLLVRRQTQEPVVGFAKGCKWVDNQMVFFLFLVT